MEFTFYVMRNAGDKIVIALGGEASQVEGTERYCVGADGQTVFT